MRAALQHGLATPRVWYCGPMFRHERPQRGRYRQFDQFGVECVGEAGADADVEVVALAAAALEAVGLPVSSSSAATSSAATTTLLLNSLGGAESQRAYTAQLRDYLEAHRGSLSGDSQRRLERGAVLRVLDSKSAADAAVVASAPRSVDSLTAEDGERFQAVCEGLASCGVPFTLEHRLVRGLDYYCHTAFECVATAAGEGEGDGAPLGTVLAGGRYDGLAEALGSKKRLPAVGWAAGLDRLALLTPIRPPAQPPLVVVVAIGGGGAEGSCSATSDATARVGHALRAQALASGAQLRVRAFAVPAKARKQLQRAEKLGASAVVLVGGEEAARRGARVKGLGSGKQVDVGLEGLLEAVVGLV